MCVCVCVGITCTCHTLSRRSPSGSQIFDRWALFMVRLFALCVCIAGRMCQKIFGSANFESTSCLVLCVCVFRCTLNTLPARAIDARDRRHESWPFRSWWSVSRICIQFGGARRERVEKCSVREQHKSANPNVNMAAGDFRSNPNDMGICVEYIMYCF